MSCLSVCVCVFARSFTREMDECISGLKLESSQYCSSCRRATSVNADAIRMRSVEADSMCRSQPQTEDKWKRILCSFQRTPEPFGVCWMKAIYLSVRFDPLPSICSRRVHCFRSQHVTAAVHYEIGYVCTGRTHTECHNWIYCHFENNWMSMLLCAIQKIRWIVAWYALLISCWLCAKL